MGAALQRSLIATQEQLTHEQAQQQATRNALLAAISHDYRTPLATIMSAASSLHDQAERLDVAQRRRVERVMRLKQAPETQPASGRLPMSTIQAKLDRSRDSLKQLSGEAP